MIMTPGIESNEEYNNLRISLHLEDLLEQKAQNFNYITWCAEHAGQVSKMITGSLSIIGFWVYCNKDEFKEIKTQNLLLAILSKSKKTIKPKDSLFLLPFYAESRPETLPEVWLPEESTHFIKSKEPIKFNKNTSRIVQLNANFPFSLVYPLPLQKKGQQEKGYFRLILKKICEDFHEYISSLRYTLNSRHYEDYENISSVNSLVKFNFLT